MKKFLIAAGCIALVTGFIGCGGASGNDPGSSYAPDMYFSRAVEAYGYNNPTEHGIYDYYAQKGIHYNGLPVPGTVARGDMNSYYLTNDSAGLASAQSLRNPLDTAAAEMVAGGMKEAERLYLINCGVCHGAKLDGNGPLWNNGNGAYPAAPPNLLTDPVKGYTDGHYFHVITFGIRSMGSYASQLRPEQRWWVIKYMRQMQGGGTSTSAQAADAPGTTTPMNNPAATPTGAGNQGPANSIAPAQQNN